jgi:hypothetical protein
MKFCIIQCIGVQHRSDGGNATFALGGGGGGAGGYSRQAHDRG